MHSLLIEKIQANPGFISADTEQQYTATDVSWQAYEALLADLGDDSPGLRVHYLEGTLEITMPGRKHEVSKDNIARLFSAYFEETRTRFYGLGSTTLKLEAQRRGAERGGIDKLEIYRGLGVPEVWFWDKGKFAVYHLRSDHYQRVERSEFLPNLDLDLLATYIQHPEPLDAGLEFRVALREQLQSCFQ